MQGAGVVQPPGLGATVIFFDVVNFTARKQPRGLESILKTLTKIVQTTLNHPDIVPHSKNIIAKIGTGDGVATVLSALPGYLAARICRCLLDELDNHNRRCGCLHPDGNNCNCMTPAFTIRIGVGYGRGAVFQDVNGEPNFAGPAINEAARVMGLADGSQILFSGEAKRVWADEPGLHLGFVDRWLVPVKHGQLLRVWQVKDGEVDGIPFRPNTKTPRTIWRFWRQIFLSLLVLLAVFGAGFLLPRPINEKCLGLAVKINEYEAASGPFSPTSGSGVPARFRVHGVADGDPDECSHVWIMENDTGRTDGRPWRVIDQQPIQHNHNWYGNVDLGPGKPHSVVELMLVEMDRADADLVRAGWLANPPVPLNLVAADRIPLRRE